MHLAPVKPVLAQSHEYALTPSTHLPPLRHSALAVAVQSSMLVHVTPLSVVE